MFYIIVLLLFITFYWYGIRTFGYWKKRGIKNDYPLPYFGNNFNQFFQKSSYAMTATEIYKKYPEEKVVGFFRSTAPELVIRDPDIVKRILVTDFQHFYARGFNTHKTVIEPLLKNLFFADGDLWRLIRQRFGSAFSTAKIRAMFPFISDRAEKLQFLAKEIEHLEYYDMRELMARYTTDFIGACGFGINMDSLNNENSEFRRLGKRIFHRTPRDAIVGALKFIFPELCKNMHFLAPDLEQSVFALVQHVLKARNYTPCGTNDFIDLLLELKEKGNVVESLEYRDNNGTAKLVELKLDDLLLTAQVFVFFGAGFETSSSTSSFTLHQLAFNSDHQKKVQEEIDRVLLKHNNKITYDAINEMHYLEKAFYEAMRMYPAVGFLMRKCTTQNYTFPEIGLTIDEGVNVIIPIQALHRDEKYFHEPNVYNPDRFTSAQDLKTNYFLPFGEGPRACIGARLGKVLAMAGIAAVLQKFNVEPCEKSKLEPIPDPKAIVAEGFVGGLPLKLRKRELK
ncbi:cytochrome P450 6B7-like [Maniola hyperantus]|uniref:cytochrome P450 6B7-like n=1 Tax=Aphantopus hyperantus TaxID=2795564 RepID=UPI00156A5AA1|nr:cytochrome P450 6B7-like [Maniola hyperantus]